MDSELRALVVGSGFEPLKAKPADLESAPIGHSGNPIEYFSGGVNVEQPFFERKLVQIQGKIYGWSGFGLNLCLLN